MLNNIKIGLADYIQGFKLRSLWMLLGWSEIRQKYARSKIGPFWLTISMAVMITALGFLYGSLFKTDLKDYIPLLAIGFVFWAFISTTINEGCAAYISAGSYIRQVSLPRGIFIYQTIWRNLIILAHNFIIVILVLVFFKINFLQNFHVFIFGFILVLWNISWITSLLALLCARFRDLPQIVASIIQVVFYITPILFKKDMLEKYPLIIDLNPFSHFIEVIRSPLLGGEVNNLSWIFCIFMGIIGTFISLLMHGKYRTRIPYWV